MTSHRLLRLAAAALLTCGFAVAHATPLAAAEHRAAKDAVAATYKSDKAACQSVKGNARDICKAEADSKERVALAQIAYGQEASTANAVKVSTARAHGSFEVAKEQCDELSGQPKAQCRTEAKAVHTKALADAKLVKTVDAARTDARDDKMSADRKVAMEKCEALSGDPKAACVAAVKTRFDKS